VQKIRNYGKNPQFWTVVACSCSSLLVAMPCCGFAHCEFIIWGKNDEVFFIQMLNPVIVRGGVKKRCPAEFATKFSIPIRMSNSDKNVKFR
jgi:hypothetical protein